MTMYKENGYSNREDYLKSLAEGFDMEYKDVLMLAITLGEEEDFDGLIAVLEDHCEGWY